MVLDYPDRPVSTVIGSANGCSNDRLDAMMPSPVTSRYRSHIPGCSNPGWSSKGHRHEHGLDTHSCLNSSRRHRHDRSFVSGDNHGSHKKIRHARCALSPRSLAGHGTGVGSDTQLAHVTIDRGDTRWQIRRRLRGDIDEFVNRPPA